MLRPPPPFSRLLSAEDDLRGEFEEYGPIKSVVLVRHRETGKSRGYAFVEFDDEKDMPRAVRHADGRRIKVRGDRVMRDAWR